ncbi:hypothetical protein COY32_06255 [candidate division WWE3 bacterium CG_4_10_14_0_2_um_filter_41_14]|uniref:Type II secretion system protein GspG C-terminal domain-containing protein n=1 Tax=candidate division WWE3 bacterium CG_4_10_14_0_2_um_filter_41_14 TaxID=1975072 RepID=A0A2M7TFB6_UNCKA|nr:MAG: hypothetical protein COY32_06255 [candidate division WWE3 bacterium CG_4_10_14_0_2_um_filter_41_14]
MQLMPNNTSLKGNRGFTLIELLVVIVIIGLLAGIGISSFTGAIQRGRDAKRISDITEIGGALKRYFIDNGKYPGSADGVPNTGQKIGVGNAIDTLLKPYLEIVPKDPIDDGSVYFYAYDPQHCADVVSGSCACDGTVISALSINRLEIMESPSKVTCSGGDQNIHHADYNKAFLPAAP